MKQCFHRSVYWKSIVNWELLIHVTIDVYSYFSTHFPAHSTLETPYPRSRLVAGAEGREVLTGPGGCKLRDRILLSCGNTAILQRGSPSWCVCRIYPKHTGKEDPFLQDTQWRWCACSMRPRSALTRCAATPTPGVRTTAMIPPDGEDPIGGGSGQEPPGACKTRKVARTRPFGARLYSLIVRDSKDGRRYCAPSGAH